MRLEYTNRAVVVRRPWPGGPPRGTVIQPTGARRESLLRLRAVEEMTIKPAPEEPKPTKRTRADVRVD